MFVRVVSLFTLVVSSFSAVAFGGDNECVKLTPRLITEVPQSLDFIHDIISARTSFNRSGPNSRTRVEP